jgi:hypothetical protein
MSYQKNPRSNLFAIAGLILITAVALWQFYLFVTFKDAVGAPAVQGGSQHLWWAIGLGVIGCIAAVLYFSLFLRYDRNDEMHITSQGRAL